MVVTVDQAKPLGVEASDTEACTRTPLMLSFQVLSAVSAILSWRPAETTLGLMFEDVMLLDDELLLDEEELLEEELLLKIATTDEEMLEDEELLLDDDELLDELFEIATAETGTAAGITSL